MVRIGVLTSSRADFGVYLPLLKALAKESTISIDIIAFGTHLSNMHGYTIDEIKNNGFKVRYEISSVLINDSEEAIATSAALTSLKFSSFWANNKNNFDIVFCIGDRYEMFSAVIAGVPFGIKFAHFYGGDLTYGAIDNIYRDCITHSSVLHFASTERCAKRIKLLTGKKEDIHVVGILSLESLKELKLLSIEAFDKKWGINLNTPSVLITIHPETINANENYKYVKVIEEVLYQISENLQCIITLPNADTNGNIFRNSFQELIKHKLHNIFLIENFGIQSYFTCMKYANLMVGNTSSGISEAASFNKYFINIGNRQKGRMTSKNVVHSNFNTNKIIKLISTFKNKEYFGTNIYEKENAIETIIQILKNI